MTGRGVGVVLVAFAIGMVSGCTGADKGDVDAAAYVEPGWMAEARAEREEHYSALARCLRGEGLNADDANGTVVIPLDPTTGEALPGAHEAASAGLRVCHERVGEFDLGTDLVEEYQRALDLGECLQDQGFEVSTSPSEETWIDDVRAERPHWNPLLEVIDVELEAGRLPTVHDARRLADQCPPSVYTEVGLNG